MGLGSIVARIGRAEADKMAVNGAICDRKLTELANFQRVFRCEGDFGQFWGIDKKKDRVYYAVSSESTAT
jgi:hypothetical protein